jgi:hypothetical protein
MSPWLFFAIMAAAVIVPAAITWLALEWRKRP